MYSPSEEGSTLGSDLPIVLNYSSKIHEIKFKQGAEENDFYSIWADANGNWVYADLRLSLGMYQSEAERNQLIEQERQRRAAHDNDANPQHIGGRPPRPRPRNQGNHR